MLAFAQRAVHGLGPGRRGPLFLPVPLRAASAAAVPSGAGGRRDPGPPRRTDYAHVLAIQTRFGDNDQYGHLNNTKYYELADTVVNAYLINQVREGFLLAVTFSLLPSDCFA